MTTTDASDPLVVRGPAGLLAAIPATLGFHPRDSLVQVCLSGPRARVGPMGRVDLDHPAGDRPQDYIDGVTATLLAVARRHAESVVLVWYRSPPGRRPALVAALVAALTAEGIAVRDVISVRGGQFRHEGGAGVGAVPRSPDDAGHPVPGPDDPDVLRLRASAALRGRTVLADREELRRSIEGPTDAAVMARALSAFGHRAATRPPGVQVYAVELDQALLECASQGSLTPRRTAEVVLGLDDPALGNHLIDRAVGEPDQPWTAMLAACARNTPTAHAAELCALLALVAYCEGDGALAQVAVDRSLRARPGHRMARVLVHVMAAGIHPREVAGFLHAGRRAGKES